MSILIFVLSLSTGTAAASDEHGDVWNDEDVWNDDEVWGDSTI